MLLLESDLSIYYMAPVLLFCSISPLEVALLDSLHELHDDILHLTITDSLVDEGNLATDRAVLDAGAHGEAVEVLRAVHADAERDTDELVDLDGAAEVAAGGCGAALALEVLDAERAQNVDRASSEGDAERRDLRERAREALCREEVDEGSCHRRSDVAHARVGVGRARRVEGTEHRALQLGDEDGKLLIGDLREVCLDELADERAEFSLAVVVHRAQIERLAEHEEVARGEQREHLERGDGVACGDESKRAAKKSVSARTSQIWKAYLTAWLCISADWMCEETGLAR